MNRKVVVVGLDGATWNLIKPWAENGELPTIRKLMDSGIHCDLEAPMPVTVPSWACYSTGKNPGKFGVFDWSKVDVRKETTSMVNYKDIRSKEIWDYLNEYGIKTGIINVPHTYPPKPVYGFMISGMLASEKTNYTHPSTLKNELNKTNYKIHPRYLANENKEKCLEEVKSIIRIRVRVAKEKLDEVDFLHLTIFYIDHLQHFLWDDPGLLEVWKVIDEEIAKLLEKLKSYGTKYNLILMSDHGFTRSKSSLSFYLNNFLAEEYGISLKKSIYYLARLGINLEDLSKLAKKLGIYEWRGLLPKKLLKLLRSLPTSQGVIGFEEIGSKINWAKSNFIGGGGFVGLVYVKKKDKKAIEKLKNKWMRIKDPETGEKVIEEIKQKEEIFSGQFLDYAPELVIFPREGYTIRGGISKEGIFLREKWKATHKKEGIFLLYGDDIKKCNRSNKNKISIYDLAPTILALYGIPIPNDMDGKVLSQFTREGGR